MDGTGLAGGERESDNMIKPISKVGEMMVQVGEIRRYLEVRSAECEDLKADNKVMQDEIINLQTLLDLDNEECKLKEISLYPPFNPLLREDESGGEDDDGDNDGEDDDDDEDDDARGENSLDTLHSIRYYQLLLAPGKH